MIHLKKKKKTKKEKKVELKVATYLWGPIDPIGTICIGKGWGHRLNTQSEDKRVSEDDQQRKR